MSDSLSPSAMRETLVSSDPIALLDIRPSLDYVEGHIQESTRVPRRDLEFRLPELVPNRSTPVVLCDNHGERAPRDARWLETLGYENIKYLEGGVAAWREVGFDLMVAKEEVHATAFNYESKEFGECVSANRDLPTIQPDELAADKDDVTVVDVRNPPEYEKWGTIPGSINVEGFDLPLYVEAVREDDEPVVVHCAGRTRSIIGTATLRELGIDNIYELENGTMGWQLAGYDLTDGPGQPEGLEIDPIQYDQLRESAERLLRGTDVPFLSPAELEDLDKEVADQQSVYVFDVRTEAEYSEGHLPSALHVAGGQLVQTAGQHISIHDAEIVLVSEGHVRAAITAYWLSRMGFSNVNVLRGGTTAWEDSSRRLGTDDEDDAEELLSADHVADVVEYVSAFELVDAISEGDVTVVSVADIDTYVDGHVPGAWWLPRYELVDTLASDFDAEGEIVVTCETGAISELAAVELGEHANDVLAGKIENVTVLDGGLAAWRESGLELEEGDERILRKFRKAARKPYAQGDREMEQYLEWEKSLVE